MCCTGTRMFVSMCDKVGFTTLRLRYAQPRAWAAGHRVVDKSNERIDIMCDICIVSMCDKLG